MYRMVLVCLLASLTALAVPARAAEDKRAEISPLPFLLGSRYGRSSEPRLKPRNDRFFMSRYGKRAPPPPALTCLLPSGAPLLCTSLPPAGLYRCRPATTNYYNLRKSDGGEEAMAEEE